MVDWVERVYPRVVALLCVYVRESFGLFCVLNFWDNQVAALLVFLFKILETQVIKYLLFLIFKLVSVGIELGYFTMPWLLKFTRSH